MADSEESWKLAKDDSWASKTANDGNSAAATANETQVEVLQLAIIVRSAN